MNYKRIYDQLIDRSKTRILAEDAYSEKHHIVPRCMDGSDDLSNIAILTLEEHFLAHRLLAKIYPDNLGLLGALRVMAAKQNKQYGWARREYYRVLAEQGLPAEWRAAISRGRKGIIFTEEHRRNIGLAQIGRESPNKGKPMPENIKLLLSQLYEGVSYEERFGEEKAAEVRQNQSKSRKGKTKTEEHKEAIGDSLTNWWANNTRSPSPETRKKIGDSRRGIPRDPAIIAKGVATRKAKREQKLQEAG